MKNDAVVVGDGILDEQPVIKRILTIRVMGDMTPKDRKACCKQCRLHNLANLICVVIYQYDPIVNFAGKLLVKFGTIPHLSSQSHTFLSCP
jgi:hypothetical protein